MRDGEETLWLQLQPKENEIKKEREKAEKVIRVQSW